MSSRPINIDTRYCCRYVEEDTKAERDQVDPDCSIVSRLAQQVSECVRQLRHKYLVSVSFIRLASDNLVKDTSPKKVFGAIHPQKSVLIGAFASN